MHALHGLAVERLGFLVPAEFGRRGAQAHLVVHRRRQLTGGLGVAIGPERVQGLARGAADLARRRPAEHLRQHDGDQIDQPAQGLEDQDDEDPVELAVGAHHVHAQQQRQDERQAERRQSEGHHCPPSRAGCRGSAFSAGASLSTSA